MKFRVSSAATALTLVALLLIGCGGNSSSSTVAPVYLSVQMVGIPTDFHMSSAAPVTIGTITITSHPKSPGETLSTQDDVILNEWVVTPARVDGGTVASPVWKTFEGGAYVPANGTLTLNNYPIFPQDYYTVQPLVQLFPENGGVDKETGNSNIRQTLQVSIYGQTVAGRAVVLSFSTTINFLY